MRRSATVLVGVWLLTSSIGFGQEPWRPSWDRRAGADGVQVSQLPGEKKPAPDKKPQVLDKEKPPEIAAEPAPVVSQLPLAERRVAQVPEMLGDIPAAGRFAFGLGRPPDPALIGPGQPLPPPPVVPVGIIPGFRSLKVADNGSARPQDRFYFSFNYYDNLYDEANRAVGSDVRNMRLYRETFGVEKTFFDRRVSLGLRLPFNTLSLESALPGVGGSHSAVGDLSIIMQAAVFRNVEADNYLSLGLAITPPTGPSTLGNIGVIPGPHTTTLQPFLAYLLNAGDFFVQGFSAVDFATGTNQVALLLNDVGLGVFVLRAEERQFITAIAPAFEVHSAVALNTSSNFGPGNPNAYANVVDFGFVGNVEFLGRSRLAAGVVFPVSSPRPFDAEAIAQFRFIF